MIDFDFFGDRICREVDTYLKRFETYKGTKIKSFSFSLEIKVTIIRFMKSQVRFTNEITVVFGITIFSVRRTNHSQLFVYIV